MKKLLAILFALVLALSFAACGGENKPEIPEDDGVVDNMVIGGEEVSAVDFVTESCNKFIESEEFIAVKAKFEENYGEAAHFTVTRVVDLKAYGLGQSKMDIHYLLIKADCSWANEESSFGDILLVADYDTGEVYSCLTEDESWMNDSESKEYWTYVMLNGPLCGSGYDGGALINDDIETRSEFNAEDIAAVNSELVK